MVPKGMDGPKLLSFFVFSGISESGVSLSKFSGMGNDLFRTHWESKEHGTTPFVSSDQAFSGAHSGICL